MLSIREWMVENRHKYATDKESDAACVAELGVSPKSVRNKRSKLGLVSCVQPSDRMEAFRSEHDRSFIVPKKVHEVIKSWLSTEEIIWCPDSEMQQQCGISSSAEWKHFARENAEFESFIFRAGSKSFWACDEATRNKLQTMALRR